MSNCSFSMIMRVVQVAQLVTRCVCFQTKVSVLDTTGPKYFVLTFVLCGSVAGVVLAVVAIYIVRRHSQSKDKLKQLANAGHDGQEASKDYQVTSQKVTFVSAK